jgi:hypothetical protein
MARTPRKPQLLVGRPLRDVADEQAMRLLPADRGGWIRARVRLHGLAVRVGDIPRRNAGHAVTGSDADQDTHSDAPPDNDAGTDSGTDTSSHAGPDTGSDTGTIANRDTRRNACSHYSSDDQSDDRSDRRSDGGSDGLANRRSNGQVHAGADT